MCFLMELQLPTTVTVTVDTDIDCGVMSPFVFLLASIARALSLTVSDSIALRKGCENFDYAMVITIVH